MKSHGAVFAEFSVWTHTIKEKTYCFQAVHWQDIDRLAEHSESTFCKALKSDRQIEIHELHSGLGRMLNGFQSLPGYSMTLKQVCVFILYSIGVSVKMLNVCYELY